ncbi:hypothetical protein HUJ04_000152 [Dendroctonus ponderosae]|nr:hypothetical protein HUJ04_000152 [Dendroctonus ponderosae]
MFGYKHRGTASIADFAPGTLIQSGAGNTGFPNHGSQNGTRNKHLKGLMGLGRTGDLRTGLPGLRVLSQGGWGDACTFWMCSVMFCELLRRVLITTRLRRGPLGLCRGFATRPLPRSFDGGAWGRLRGSAADTCHTPQSCLITKSPLIGCFFSMRRFLAGAFGGRSRVRGRFRGWPIRRCSKRIRRLAALVGFMSTSPSPFRLRLDWGSFFSPSGYTPLCSFRNLEPNIR